MRNDQTPISFSVVTGASSGIGLELARVAAQHGSDLLIAADGPDIESAAEELRAAGVNVDYVMTDLATPGGVDVLYRKMMELGRPVDALFANAGRGLSKGFLDQDFGQVQRVLDTNITGTVYLLHRVLNEMRSQGRGRVLITGSIAGLIPGSYNAIYNASKAFIDSFAYALRQEVKDDGITITLLMPGPTDTDFFETADLLDTKLGTAKKDDPRMVAEEGYKAMLRGDGHEVTGFANKLQAMMTRVLGDQQLARMHEGLAKPGSGSHQHH